MAHRYDSTSEPLEYDHARRAILVLAVCTMGRGAGLDSQGIGDDAALARLIFLPVSL